MIELFEPRMWFVPEGPGDPTGEPLGEAIAEIRRQVSIDENNTDFEVCATYFSRLIESIELFDPKCGCISQNHDNFARN